MNTTIEIKINNAKGYTGKKSGKSYLARIAGMSNQYGLDREFLTAAEIDWGTSELFKKSKGVWTEIYRVGEGLYETQTYGERAYRLVGVWAAEGQTEATLRSMTIDEAHANKIADLMSGHLGVEWTIDEARRLSLLDSARIASITAIVHEQVSKDLNAAFAQQPTV